MFRPEFYVLESKRMADQLLRGSARPPIFVRGHLSFDLDGNHLEFLHRRISVFGVTSLPWGPLNPREHFGRTVDVGLQFISDPGFRVEAKAIILRELTKTTKYMGLRLKLDLRQTEQLSQLIAKNGFYPNDHVRKYPRIPSSFILKTFPLKALGKPPAASVGAVTAEAAPMSGVQILFDVGNLSPNGVLLSTESQLALAYNPDDLIQLTLEARGWFPVAIQVQGAVRRILDEIHPRSGNLTRYLGVEFMSMDEVNRQAFLDLLRDILRDLKKQAVG